jgi:hypothetical protein
MAFSYQVNLSDPSIAAGSDDAAFVYDLQQALGVWSNYISGLGTLVVALDIDNTTSDRAAGGPASSYAVGTNDGIAVLGPSSLWELTTGTHVSGSTSDITIIVSPSYLQYLDLSPGLTCSSQVPDDKYNPIVLFMHELAHGFGMSGYYSQSGALAGNYESTFDADIRITPDGNAYFLGPNAVSSYGGPVPLTTTSSSENYYHFGNQQSDQHALPSTVQDTLTRDLMNGIVCFFDYDYAISPLDLAVLKDIGYNLSSVPAFEPGLAVQDTTINQPVTATSCLYAGPVDGLQEQYINVTSHSLNISVSTSNWFIHSGSGDDAIAVSSGTNVLDGGSGSNFITGGSGADTFFVDDRAAPTDIWSTVDNFRAGDAATVWGVTAQDFGLAWMDSQGASDFTGLTLHATAAGRATASLTLAGYTQADLGNGRLSVLFGNDPASGSAYMNIHGNS